VTALGEKLGRVEKPVGDAIVDARQARGTGIRDPGDLNRRWFRANTCSEVVWVSCTVRQLQLYRVPRV
jgi:hypothetical protein